MFHIHSKGFSSLLTRILTVLLLLLLLLLSPRAQGAGRGDADQGSKRLPKHKFRDKRVETMASDAVVNARIGSRPPSCLNKCDSCTPCRAVQASKSQQSLTQMYIGSRPPSCQNKCNRCIPCQAVQVPTPQERRRVPMPSAADESQTPTKSRGSGGGGSGGSSGGGGVSIQYSNYKPEGWRCKCGNKLFNP